MSAERTGTVSTELLTPVGERLLTKAEVLEDLRAVVADKGADYRYREVVNGSGAACSYLDADGAPSCIVGHVAARRGWLHLEAIQRNEELEWEPGPLPVTFGAHQVLRAAQQVQDTTEFGVDGPRRTWGEALQAAEEMAAFVDEDAPGWVREAEYGEEGPWTP